MTRLDKNIKHKLEHMTVPVADHNWEKIANRLDSHDAKRPLMWPYYMLASFILIGLGGIFVFEEKPNNSLQSKKEIASASDISLEGNANSNSSNTMTANDTRFQVSNNSQKLTKNLDILASDLNIIKNNILDDQANFDQSNSTISYSDLQVDGLNPSILSELDMPANSISVAPENIELKSSDALALLSSHNHQEAISITSIKKSPSFTKVKKEAKSCPFGIEANTKSLDLYVSHDFVDKTYSAAGSEFDPIIAMRESSESPMYSFSVGAKFGYNISYRWNIHTGLNYSQINEKFRYIDPESIQEVQIKTKEFIFENGVIVDSIETVETKYLTGTVKFEKMNKFRSIDIPLIGRYTILANKNLSLSATVGAYLNLSHLSSGTIVDLLGDPANIMDGKINKTQLGVSSYTGISFAYHLAGDLDFILEPHARIFFDNINRDSYPINQRNNIYGISTGVRYKF
jgi:hypothetical protein